MSTICWNALSQFKSLFPKANSGYELHLFGQGLLQQEPLEGPQGPNWPL